MRKVGLVTLWKANYGSALQCYATKHILQSMACECVLIERRERSVPVHFLKKIENRLYRYCLLLCNIGKFREMNAAVKAGKSQVTRAMPKALEDFVNDKLCPQSFTTAELKRMGKNAAYSAFLSGSDQVWNGACMDRWMMGFLHFAPGEKRIAFAPSFGSDNIQKYNIKRFVKYISAFRILSARESSAALRIEQMTGRQCKRLIDPVLQLSKEEWLAILEKEHVPARGEGNYVVAYFLDAPSEQAITYVHRVSGDLSANVVVLPTDYQEFSSIRHTAFDEGPLEFLRLIEGADYIVTDSFHTTAFALCFERPFYTFKRQYTHAYDQSARIESLLELCGANERFERDGMFPDPKEPIAFDEAAKTLERERTAAKEYIVNALSASNVNLQSSRRKKGMTKIPAATREG